MASSKCARLLGELSNLRVNVAAVQETHFTCAVDCRVLEDNYVVLSAYGTVAVLGSLLIRRSLNADVNLVFADDRGWLVVADIAVKSFQVAGIYVPNIAVEKVSFFVPLRVQASYTTSTSKRRGWLKNVQPAHNVRPVWGGRMVLGSLFGQYFLTWPSSLHCGDLWLTQLAESFKIRVAAVYAPNIAAKRVSFLAVTTVPWRSEKDSFSGWLECDPGSQDRQGREGSLRVGKVWKQPDRFYGPSWFGRQVSSGSPWEGDVDVAR